jgi:hypothetical protein
MVTSSGQLAPAGPPDQSLCRRDVLACVPSVIQLNQEPEPVTSTPNRAFGECTALAGVIAIPTLCASAASSGEQAGSSGQPAGNGNGNVGGLAALAAAALGIAGEAADAAEAAAQASEEQTAAEGGATAAEAAAEDGGGAAARVFYSGGDAGKIAAAKFAAENGGETLDMTEQGQALAEATEGMSPESAQPLWEAASKSFAQGASGIAHVFINLELAGPESIWTNIELRALVENPNVTDVIFHLIGG